MMYDVAQMLGCTFTAVTVNEDRDEIVFEGPVSFRMYHSQDCCETVELEEVIGDLSDLVGSPIIEAECVTNCEDNAPEYADSFTWTFYKLGTRKGHVTLRWLGQSNGYYSEAVDVIRIGHD